MSVKVLLSPRELPRQWYNILPDLPKPLPPVIHPATKHPVSPEDLLPIFPEPLIEQEVSPQRWIDIPEEVLDIYALWRPTPLQRAKRLEQFLRTPAQIWKPQTQHRRRSGLLQQNFGRQAIDDGDGSGAMGQCPRFRHMPVRAQMHCLHGQSQLPPKALSARFDGNMGC